MWRSIRIGPIAMQLVRVIASLIAGILAAFFFYALDALFDANFLSVWMTLLLGILLAIWFALDDDEPVRVPVAYGALLTFLGMRTPFWISEGYYPWIGRRLFFDYFKYSGNEMANLPNYVPGFVFTGELVLPIWNSAVDEDNTTLSNVARDGSTITTNLTVVLQIVNLAEWIDSSQPIFDIAERARAAFRTAVAFFTGVDCYSAKTLLGKLMTGHSVITAFVRDEKGSRPKLSMIQDASGAPLYSLVERDACNGMSEQERSMFLQEVRKQFWQEVMDRVEESMRRSAGFVDEEAEDLKCIQMRSVDHHLLNVIHDVGARFIRASVGDVTLSEEVAKQANRAAGEVFQRDAQMISARTTKAATKELLPDEEMLSNPGYKDAVLISAAQDNPGIKIVHVPDGDSLIRAAVAGGSQIGGEK